MRSILPASLLSFLLVNSVLAAPPATNAPAKLSFAVETSGKGRPVILVPGYACSGAVWNGTVAHLRDHYQCHVLTLAGFAGQPRVEGPFLETVRKDLAAYIRS